jgi:hypothetical protein
MPQWWAWTVVRGALHRWYRICGTTYGSSAFDSIMVCAFSPRICARMISSHFFVSSRPPQFMCWMHVTPCPHAFPFSEVRNHSGSCRYGQLWHLLQQAKHFLPFLQKKKTSSPYRCLQKKLEQFWSAPLKTVSPHHTGKICSAQNVPLPRLLLRPSKRKKKICKGILPIWSTKWNLFTKLFTWMGCKSRDESNDAN